MRRLLQPRWLVAHVVILTILVTFPQLGMWQLRRYDQEQSRQQRLTERLEQAPVPLDGAIMRTPDEREYTPVTVTGVYRQEETVHQRNRAYQGRNGFDVLTPLALGDGRAVLVRRGWVPPTTATGNEPTTVATTDVEVTVTGWLEESDEQPGFGPTDAADGDLQVVFHADVQRLDPQVSGDLVPVILHLAAQDPAQDGDLPVPQPVPVIDAGSNLSYAVQWFTFTAIAAIGYGIVIWRRIRGLDEPDDHARA
jgi:cytochrome oxidase assembly protein ShyY1